MMTRLGCKNQTLLRCALAHALNLFLIAACALPATAARAGEPNDTTDSATPILLEQFGSVRIGGYVGDGPWAERDVDIYRISISPKLEPPFLIELELIGQDELDGFLRLFDAEGRELANNDDGNSEGVNARLRTYLLDGADYFVGVSSSGNPHYDVTNGGSGRSKTIGPYALDVALSSATLPQSPFEPNDSYETAPEMGSYSFWISNEFIGDGPRGRRDIDFYHMDLTGPALVEITVRARAIGSTLDPLLDVDLRQQGGDGSYISPRGMGFSDDTDESLDSKVSIVVPYHVREYGSLYIRVSGTGNRREPTEESEPEPVGSVGRYDLRVVVTYFDGDAPDEPNDSPSRPTPTTISGPDQIEVLQGFVGDGPYAPGRGDRDFFEVRLDASSLLLVEVAPLAGSDLDPVVAVYDYFGKLIASGDNVGSSTRARVPVAVGCAVGGGYQLNEVYVMVMGARQRFPNDPLVPAWFIPGVGLTRPRFEEYAVGDGAGSTGAYELTLSTQSECGQEPDNTLATATDSGIQDEGLLVCSGGRLDDSECERGLDVDMWSVQLTNGPRMLKVSNSGCADAVYVILRVFDSDGSEIARSRMSEEPSVEVVLETDGTYYVGISHLEQDDYDPHVACSGSGYFDPEDPYHVLIELLPVGGGPRRAAPAGGEGEESEPVLFATRLGAESGVIDVIDPDTGQITSSFAAPEPVSGGAEGLAYDGTDLYFVGAGRFPNMYRMDPVSGEIIEKTILWSGSGFYSDAVMLGGELFLMDFFDNRLHVIDPVEPRLLRTLPVGAINGIRISGGMGALSKPNRLYVADAFGTGVIHEIRPDIGTVTGTLHTETVRPTALAGIGTRLLYAADWMANQFESIDRYGEGGRVLSLPNRIGTLGGAVATGLFADFDQDGDIDLDDFARFQVCFTGEGGDLEPGCEPGDANGDNAIDQSDLVAFTRAMTGP